MQRPVAQASHLTANSTPLRIIVGWGEAHAGGPATLEARRTAMREIGRALALDPESTPAIQTMVSLLTEPRATMPPEVEVEIEIDRECRPGR